MSVLPTEFCNNCQRWLTHYIGCPHFPNEAELDRHGKPKIWEKCMCLIHTCYMAPKRDKATAPTYVD